MTFEAKDAAAVFEPDGDIVPKPWSPDSVEPQKPMDSSSSESGDQNFVCVAAAD